jgi:fucose permease
LSRTLLFSCFHPYNALRHGKPLRWENPLKDKCSEKPSETRQPFSVRFSYCEFDPSISRVNYLTPHSFYQGAEVAISGWVISYLIHYRRGDPSHVGNVTSGFWAGITVGRFVLTHFAQKIGEKVAVMVLIIGAAVCQLLVWLVPNIIGNAVAESIVGLFLGPIYPCATAVFAKLLPRDIQISSLSVVTSMGSSGGALVPFITGILAQNLSTVVLHPVVLISFGAMTITWLLLPRIGKRAE